MHFQGPRSGEALVTLWKRADAGGLVGTGVALLHDGLRLALPPAAVVHQMGLEVPLAPEPDPTSFAGKDVLWWGRGGGQRGHHIRIYEALSYLCPSTEIKSLHICTRAHTSTVPNLKACVKRLFRQILGCCISLCCYHWVGALSQGQTRTLDHLLTEASLSS